MLPPPRPILAGWVKLVYMGSLRRLAASPGLVLWIGFGGLLALLIVMATHAGQVLGQLESSNRNIRQDFLQRDDLLDSLRLDLYRSAAVVRDLLLDPDPIEAELRRSDLEKTRARMNAALQQYERVVPGSELAAAGELKLGLAEYWTLLQPALQLDPVIRRRVAPALLRDVIFPRYRQLQGLAGQIATINEKQAAEAERRVAEVFSNFRSRLIGSAVLAIGLGLALAVFSSHRILSLERLSAHRYTEAVHAREELKRLSTRLVAIQEEERRRLSRELHDEVGQSMSAMLVELGNLEASLPESNHPLRERFSLIRRMAETTVGSVRNMALLLRPSMLDDLGLVPALRWQAKEVARRTGMKVTVTAEGVSDDLPDEWRTCVYRIVQEALQNASRHAGAKHARVTVEQGPDEIRVSIQDDGVGFDPGQEKGMGILGMEERVRALGGSLQVQAQPGAGTVVSALLPLLPAVAEAAG
jgi:signal transduction histidine kinase